jgi:ribulose-bisphosphate carboxylase small chain
MRSCAGHPLYFALSFLVQRPAEEPGFRLLRRHAAGRTNRYVLHPYAADRPHGSRYST